MLGDNHENNVAVWNLKGIFHEAMHEFDLAEQAFMQAIRIDRARLPAYANLATLLEETNKLSEARTIADQGLEIASRLGELPIAPYVKLCLAASKIARRQKQLERGIELLDRLDSIPQDEKETVQFERGKLLDLQGRPDDAVVAFARGHELARGRWAADNPWPNKFMGEIEGMLAFARRGGLDNWRRIDIDHADPELPSEPIFLIGFPRSGTTLLNQILECNSHLQTIEEKSPVGKMRDAMLAMPGGYPAAIPDCDAFDVTYLREAYFKAVRQHRQIDPGKLLVDKFPLQLAKVGLMHRVFPGARFIFSARHPCDVCLSCFMQNFRLNDAMANFFSIAEIVALYVRTMELWQVYQDKLPISVHTVRYDDMVNDVEATTRNVCGFLDVPWEESQADFATHAIRRGKIHTPSYEQVSQPIYRGALGRWEKYREYFEPHLPALQPYIDKYG